MLSARYTNTDVPPAGAFIAQASSTNAVAGMTPLSAAVKDAYWPPWMNTRTLAPAGGLTVNVVVSPVVLPEDTTGDAVDRAAACAMGGRWSPREIAAMSWSTRTAG